MGLKKLPTINMLKTEYSALAAEKKTLYGGYHQARKYMQDILTARQNAEALLGLTRGSSGAGNRAGLTVAAPTFFSVRHERAADSEAGLQPDAQR
ncbi:MAG TPA: hypothetical protein DEQ02_04275 [Ruminococcaceae bacterium]|nr:hypothetical protein [Oscillospiraceae bacterium]